MPKLPSRIVLWRNTVQLFHRYNALNFVGPFLDAGYKDYRVEPYMEDNEGDEKSPDILSVDATRKRWVELELTMFSESKHTKLDAYSRINPAFLGNYGYQGFTAKADVLSSRLSFLDDGPHCQILVDPVLKVLKEEHLDDELLRKKLISAQGVDMRRLPEIPITLHPESKSSEIRRGLVDQILQLFDPNSKGKKPEDFAREGLERLYSRVGPKKRNQLAANVKKELDDLVKNYLPENLRIVDGTYTVAEDYKPHHKTTESIARNVKKWVDAKRLDISLDEFPDKLE